MTAAIQRQACRDVQGLRQLDVAATTKVDGLSTGGTTDIALRLGIVGTVCDGNDTKRFSMTSNIWFSMTGNMWFGIVSTGRLNMGRAKLLGMGRATGKQIACEQAESR